MEYRNYNGGELVINFWSNGKAPFHNLSNLGKIRFLSIPNNEALAAMQLELTPYKVPRGIYQFEGNAIPVSSINTVATGAHLITRADMGNSVVERVAQEVLKTSFMKENKLQELFDEGFLPWTGVKMVMVAASPNPTHWVDVGDSIELGIQSLKLHKAYIENLSQEFDPEMFLSMSANASGEKVGVDYAVEFQVILI